MSSGLKRFEKFYPSVIDVIYGYYLSRLALLHLKVARLCRSCFYISFLNMQLNLFKMNRKNSI
jgi:hypothetical protein